MKANLTKRCIQQTLASIEALDLEPIRLKVMDAESGKGWSGDYTDRVERNYRSHLGMLAKHLDKIGDIPVSKDVDEFWHAHILHTMKYTEDCDAVFGTYLHHNPKGSSDAAGGAFCSAAVKAKEAAFCSASVRLDGAAFCSAALEAKDAAFCSAAVKAKEVAFCSASVRADGDAFCSAALEAKDGAFCSAGVKAKEAAFCSAGVKAAFCSAAIASSRA